jgi:superfamily II DNA or RNA helicase
MKTVEQNLNTNECIANEKEVSLSIKRKSSDPYIIPWEEGEPFKLSEIYFHAYFPYYKEDKVRIYGSFEDFKGNELTLGIWGGDADREMKIKILLTEKDIGIACSCNRMVKGICKHAFYAVLYKIKHQEKLFEKYYFPNIHSLPKRYLSMFQFDMEDNNVKYYGGRPKIAVHKEFGRILNYTNKEERYSEKLQFITPQLIDFATEKILIFGIPEHKEYYMPILLPFFTKLNKQGTKYAYTDRSYIYHLAHFPPDLSLEEEMLQSVCHDMVRIDLLNSETLVLMGYDAELVEEESAVIAIKKRLIIKLWKKIIPALYKYPIVAFRSWEWSKDMVRPTSSCYEPASFSLQDISINFILIERSYLQLKMEIYVAGALVEKPQLMSRYFSTFLKWEDKYILIEQVRDEEVIQHFRECNFCLTILPEDVDKFKKDILYPLAEHYPITYCRDGEDAPQFTLMGELKVIKKRISIYIRNNILYFEPQVLYSSSLTANPLYGGTLIVHKEKENILFYPQDKEEEINYRDVFLSLHNIFVDQKETGKCWLPMSFARTGTWLAETIHNLQEHQVEILGLDNLQGLPLLPHTMEWVMEIKGDNDWFDVNLEVSFGKQAVDLELLRESVRKEREMVELPDGSVGLFPKVIQQKLSSILNMGEIKKNRVRLSSKHFTSIQSFANKISDKELHEQIRLQRKKLQQLDKIQPLPKPEKVQAVLRPYQETGFSWMGFLREFGWGGVLADDMGLGKTLQVLTLLEYHYIQSPDSPASLIVVPNSLLFNWQAEFKKFVPHQKVKVHHGTNRLLAEISASKGELLLTTYGTLMADIDVFREYHFSYLILDESQAIKNPQSKRFECVQAIQSDYRLALTGTPIENRISDLFAQLDFVNPGFLGTYGQFKRNFPGIADGSASNDTKESLQSIIAPFMLRRTKAQVAKDLPEKTEMILYCEMLPEQRKIYDTYRRHFRNELEGKMELKKGETTMFVLEALMKLRQICNSPALVPHEKYENHSTKLEEIREHMLEKTQGHKLLIFSSFTAMLGLLKEELATMGIKYAYLDGKTSGEQRQDEVARFQEQEDCRVFLISLKAGGTGLNLTAADYVYILDPWWNPAAEAQAIDRCYRIGQDKQVMAYRMVCKDSIEERIIEMQDDKKALADSLVQTDNSVLKSLNKEQLLKLFE